MSGLCEDEPIVLDGEDDSNTDNGENMPSTSGTQRQVSNGDKELKDEQRDDSDAESDEYVVEAIRGKRVNKETGVEEYFIKWQNYPEKENTWEPPEHLKCEKLLKEFEEKEASKRKRRKITDSPKPTKRQEEKLFLESEDDDDDDDDDDVDVESQRSRKERKTDSEPVGVKGFARGLPLESIISGVYGDSKKLFFFVKWVGLEALEMVSNEELKQNAANELFEWYEKRLIWKNGIEPENSTNN